jgi:DNA-binding LytR/AlgR family response regulator
MNITALIADDEAHARERLRELLEQLDCFSIIGEASDGTQALQSIITHAPQVAFLDISMPGLSVFSALASLQHPPLIVFQTAYSQHAATAFEIDAVDYLLKPVRIERLHKTVAKLKERLGATVPSPPGSSAQPVAPELLAIKFGTQTRLLAPTEIIRICFEDGFCYVYTATETIISDKYLAYFEHKLASARFFRTSRTDLINLDHIGLIARSFAGTTRIELRDSTIIELSRRRAVELKAIFDF